jgi:hypothetical protein
MVPAATENLCYFHAAMNQPLDRPKSQTVVTAILTDVHFWIPTVVLLFGLWVLHWTR